MWNFSPNIFPWSVAAQDPWICVGGVFTFIDSKYVAEFSRLALAVLDSSRPPL